MGYPSSSLAPRHAADVRLVPGHVCTGTGLHWPRLHRDWAALSRPVTSAPRAFIPSCAPLMAHVYHCVRAAVMAVSQSLWELILGRVIVGVAVGMASHTVTAAAPRRVQQSRESALQHAGASDLLQGPNRCTIGRRRCIVETGTGKRGRGLSGRRLSRGGLSGGGLSEGALTATLTGTGWAHFGQLLT
jgi:uncharacterized membrane protein YgcG